MGNIPIDIAVDILCQSPAKSLARFASVSKAWSSLLSDPSFVKRHRNQHLQSQNLKLIARHGSLYSLDLDSLDCALRVDYLLKDSDFTINKVLGLSDHLLCLSVSPKSNPNPDLKSTPTLDFDNGIIVICNLSTGARLIVPPSPVVLTPSPQRSNLEKRYSYGFGFDPSGDDYKLVRISRYEYICTQYIKDVIPSESKVYSMKTKSWTKTNQDISQCRLATAEPVALDGVLYWAAGHSNSYSSNLIVAFDLALGSFRIMPPPMRQSVTKCCLLNSGGKICVMCCLSEQWLEDFIFYTMEKCRDSAFWIPMASFWCSRFVYDKALTFSKNGDKVLVEKCEDKFVCFDLAKETVGARRVEFFSMKEEMKKRVE